MERYYVYTGWVKKKYDLRYLEQNCKFCCATLLYGVFPMAQKKNPRTFFFLKIKCLEKQKCVFINYFYQILKLYKDWITENFQNCNKKICNFLLWSNFYGKIVFQWFLRFQLNSVYLILQNILRRKELENFDNFSFFLFR